MGWLKGRKNKFETFWVWFKEHEQQYFELNEAKREKEMNELYKRLQKVNKHLAFEFSHELIKGKRHFIISAEGMTEAFDDVFALFDAAPELERFEIIPFRQPSGEEVTVSYGEVDVSWDDVYFTDDSGSLDLSIYAKGFTEDNKDDYIPAIFILLDNVIGEFYVGTRLGDLVFKAYEGETEARPIAELRDVLDQVEQQNLDLGFLPPTLKKLREFDQSLRAEGLSFEEGIGVRWSDSRMAYEQTPYDVLPFMDLGVDGIHVGLLTDFGKVTDLEEAFVVCVHPMNAPDSVKLLARNPKEFVDYLYSDRHLLMLYHFMIIDSKEKFQEMDREAESDYKDHPELAEARDAVAPRLKDFMDCSRIDDIYGYVQNTVEAARQKQIVLPTNDGLGVAAFNNSGDDLPLYRVMENGDISVEDVQAFFKSAPLESKLAFIRDLQYANLINNETPIKAVITGELKNLGFDAEVARLKNLDW